ncbi:patatin-like phospholipase family protein [Streptomyces ochraceiscleroticus]|uniref:Patatin-like phospholipase family protein n=1 Tax=Streptomyces ochraceiscleroticus TaxID=47761 RepID=A0ABW1MKY9_9ACTN|nr:patatin-like phospholipase family protein [Streptomyces ochraceiscleroticus]
MNAKKRSLVLAGGGMKVAFQAGVLQVWLDEAGLQFDHVDGASGGNFNLAMYCQGMTGTQIADAWRHTNPLHGVDVNLGALLRGEALFSLDRYRSKVFPRWGLNWPKIRATDREATFNVCDAGTHTIDIVEPRHMSEDLLVASVSLPMWFPPVKVEGHTYVDAVYLTDGNLEEAVRRGADEIWVIWTVSERGEWHPGLPNIYFQTIEIAANGHFRRIVRRIEENNAAIKAGRPGEFGRPIELKILRGEVPVNYLFNLGTDRLHEAVNRGVEAAREWCAAEGISLRLPAGPPDAVPAEDREPRSLSFKEAIKGFIGFDESDYDDGYRKGHDKNTRLTARLKISIDDIDMFVTSPQHEATVTGHIECEALGGMLTVDDGTFNLFVDTGRPESQQIRYFLHLHDPQHRPYTLASRKVVVDNSWKYLWSDTTTLYTRVLDGTVQPAEDGSAKVVASGIISLHLLDFLWGLTTFRAGGPLAAKPAVFARYGALFLNRLWDVYARPILPWGPL